jgi:hypothetical protein
VDKSGGVHTWIDAKTHVLLKEEAGPIRRRHTSMEGKLTSCRKKNADWSSSAHAWIHRKTHCLLEENSGPVRQHPHIDQRENSRPVERKIGTGQAASTHRPTKNSRTVSRKIGTGQAAHTHRLARKLTVCWKKQSDRSGSIHRSIHDMIHLLLNVKNGPLMRSPNINQK